MPNSYFRFKHFIVNQQKAGMKVCTDACLFGAWVVDKMFSKSNSVESILDIGTGTGLLSLLLAQKINAAVDAVEIDEDSAQQAKENFATSPWAHRLRVTKGDVRKINLNKEYDFIICNPPFFENNLKSSDQQKNLALHSDALTFEELISAVERLLKPEGCFAMLLPFYRSNVFIDLAIQKGLFVRENTAVQQTNKHPYFRSMLLLTRCQEQEEKSKLSIKTEGDYSNEFTNLLKDYYLNL